MKKFLVLMLSIAFMAGCNNSTDKPADKPVGNIDKPVIEEVAKVDPVELPANEVAVEADNSRDTILAEYIGKPSVIILAGTFCPHCRSAMPDFKTKLWDVYNEKVNIFINVVDGKKFDVAEIPQGTNEAISYDLLTGSDCGYVPSWVLLDAKGEVSIASCGGEKSIDDMIAGIDGLLK